MTTLVVNAEADSDVGLILETICEQAVRGSLPVTSVVSTLSSFRLLQFPSSGPPKPSLGEGVRIGVASPYVIIYRYDPNADQIEILRVLHGRRDITASLMPAERGLA